MRFFTFIAYCVGLVFAAIFAFIFVQTVYSSQRVIGGEAVASELRNQDLLKDQSYVFREQHTIDLNQFEGLLTGNTHQHFARLVWETNLGVFATSYLALNFGVFIVAAFVMVFLIRLGSGSFNGRSGRRKRR